jgi:hypothetical protein
MRITSKDRSSPAPAFRRETGESAAAGSLRCRVVRKQITDKAPVKPDWDKIPTRKKLPLTERDWNELIVEQAARDAIHGKVLSGQAEKLLVEYVSQISPDRRRMYEILFRQYGERLEGYSAGDGSNMHNVNGLWEYDLTKQEERMLERFLRIYIPAFESASGEYVSGKRLFKDV